MGRPINVTIIGGGMITNDLILPSIYHLQRIGVVGKIDICALNSPPLKALKDNSEFAEAFPGQSFDAHPDVSTAADKNFPDMYKEVLASSPPRQAVVVAMPDPLHHGVVMDALGAGQHVLCVKPLVLTYDHAEQIKQAAYEAGLFVGVEYHKRFDRRSLLARRQYRQGHFGEFAMGEAKMIEPYYYRSSNFQNWFTADKTDPFTYVGCHYVDLVYFITGLKPVEISVRGKRGTFPNGNEGFMWAHGRVVYENDAMLSVTDGLGYPDDGAGSNQQNLMMFCEGKGRSGLIEHDDQSRGVIHSYLDNIGSSGSRYNYINPDFYRLVPWEGVGHKPIGYGFDSIAATINTIHRIEGEVAGTPEAEALKRRQGIIREVDDNGIIATPANSWINELVVEATRLSILKDGAPARITYDAHPSVALR